MICSHLANVWSPTFSAGGAANYVRALVRADRGHSERREALLRDIDVGQEDVEAGRVYDGEEVFSELLARTYDK